jgi:hypothetical protein
VRAHVVVGRWFAKVCSGVWCVVAGKEGGMRLALCARKDARVCGVRGDDWEDEEGDDERW